MMKTWLCKKVFYIVKTWKFLKIKIYDEVYLCIGKIIKLIWQQMSTNEYVKNYKTNLKTNEYKWICENEYHITLYETTLK